MRRAGISLTPPITGCVIRGYILERELIADRINSQGGLSEEWIGEWAEQRRVRDQLVIATKVRIESQRNYLTTASGSGRLPSQYGANLNRHDKQNTQFSGNNVKAMVLRSTSFPRHDSNV